MTLELTCHCSVLGEYNELSGPCEPIGSAELGGLIELVEEGKHVGWAGRAGRVCVMWMCCDVLMC